MTFHINWVVWVEKIGRLVDVNRCEERGYGEGGGVYVLCVIHTVYVISRNLSVGWVPV